MIFVTLAQGGGNSVLLAVIVADLLGRLIQVVILETMSRMNFRKNRSGEWPENVTLNVEKCDIGNGNKKLQTTGKRSSKREGGVTKYGVGALPERQDFELRQETYWKSSKNFSKILSKRAIKQAVSGTQIEGNKNKAMIGGKLGKCPQSHVICAKEAAEWEVSFRSGRKCSICRDDIKKKFFRCEMCMYDICVECGSNNDIDVSFKCFQQITCALVEEIAENMGNMNIGRREVTKERLLSASRATVVSLWGSKNIFEESVLRAHVDERLQHAYYDNNDYVYM